MKVSSKYSDIYTMHPKNDNEYILSFDRVPDGKEDTENFKKNISKICKTIMDSENVFDKIENRQGEQTYFKLKNELKLRKEKKLKQKKTEQDDGGYLLNIDNYQNVLTEEKVSVSPNFQIMFALLQKLEQKKKEKKIQISKKSTRNNSEKKVMDLTEEVNNKNAKGITGFSQKNTNLEKRSIYQQFSLLY